MTELSTLSFQNTEAMEQNGTQPEGLLEKITSLAMVLASICIPICILGMVGNGIVFCLLFHKIKTRFTIFILNLAVADFILLFCSFLGSLFHLTKLLKINHFDPYFSIPFDAMYLLGYNTSFYLLTAISGERCLLVFFPIWFRCHQPKHYSTIVCVLLWALSCLVTGVECFVYYEAYFSLQQYGIVRPNPAIIFPFSINFLIFTPVMVLSSLALCVKLWKSSQQTPPPRLYVTIGVAVALFLTLATPVRLAYFIMYWYPQNNLWMFIFSSGVLNSINSSSNPFIYFFVGRWRRQRLREPIHVVLQRALEEEYVESLRRQTQTTQASALE